MSVNCVSIGSDNGLSSIRRQAIILANAVLLLIRPLETNFSEILIKIETLFIHENASKNIVCEMAAILSRGSWVKWEYFPRYWPFVRGIHRSPLNRPHNGEWRGALMFSLICAWTNDWVNNRDAGDLRRHRAHYDVTVMFALLISFTANVPQLVMYSKSQGQVTFLPPPHPPPTPTPTPHPPTPPPRARAKWPPFADDIFRCIFVNEKYCILIGISLKIVSKGSIDNNPALVQVMAWCRTGDMLLSQAMLTQFIDA